MEFFWFIIAVIAIVIYCLPSLVASGREHRNTGAITVLNLFLGWTFLFWVLSLAWAFTDNCRPKSATGGIKHDPDWWNRHERENDELS